MIPWEDGKNLNDMVETRVSCGPPTLVCFLWEKKKLFAKTTVCKALCNLQSNAFLTNPLSVHAFQLISGLSPATEHTSTVLTSQQLATGLSHSNKHLHLSSSIYSQNSPTWVRNETHLAKMIAEQINVIQAILMECVIKRSKNNDMFLGGVLFIVP